MASDTKEKTRAGRVLLRRIAAGAAKLARHPRRTLPARWLKHGVLDLLFPAACVDCGREVVDGLASHDRVPICQECRDAWELIFGPTCERCSAPVGGMASRDRCIRCDGRKLWFDQTIAAGEYTGRLRDVVLRMKPRNGDALSLAVGRLIVEHCGSRLEAIRPDVVVPIPMHWRRRLAHGTNSAAVLAEVLAGELRIPFRPRCLRRLRNTPPQFTLTPTQRWKNVRHAFSVSRGYHLRKAHVLLVDDILTTGATCSEAARTLKQAGAARVTVAVAARALSH